MAKVAMTLIVALLTASLQCVAACSALPCNEAAKRPAPVEDCHHRAPASDQNQPGHGQDETGCGHQTFVSEAAPQSNLGHVDFTLSVAVLPVSRYYVEFVSVAKTWLDSSPPPRTLSSSVTILRI